MRTGGSVPARAVMTKTHGRVAAGVPRWAVVAAYAAAVTTLPSGLWRIAGIVLHVPLLEPTATATGHHGTVLFTGVWYVVALSVVSEGLAYLTVGLVSEWGEVLPRWLPGVGSRRVPVRAAVIPAGLGAVVLTLGFPYVLVMLSLGRMVDGTRGTGLVVHGWQAVVFAVAYAPLAAWGPLLGAVTVQYWRRRAAPAGEQPVAVGRVADRLGA